MSYTYSKIASYTVESGGIASVSFLAIPQNYTDLVVKASMRDTSTGSGPNDNTTITFNGDSSNGTHRELYGTGTATGSGSLSAIKINYHTAAGTGSTANTFGSAEAYIPNYTSNNYKIVSTDGVAESNFAGMFMTLGVGLWSSTAPINAITFTPAAGVYSQYTTFTLYGIKAEV